MTRNQLAGAVFGTPAALIAFVIIAFRRRSAFAP